MVFNYIEGHISYTIFYEEKIKSIERAKEEFKYVVKLIKPNVHSKLIKYYNRRR